MRRLPRGAHPIRTLAVAATDNGPLAPEPAGGIRLREVPMVLRAAHDGLRRVAGWPVVDCGRGPVVGRMAYRARPTEEPCSEGDDRASSIDHKWSPVGRFRPLPAGLATHPGESAQQRPTLVRLVHYKETCHPEPFKGAKRLAGQLPPQL